LNLQQPVNQKIKCGNRRDVKDFRLQILGVYVKQQRTNFSNLADALTEGHLISRTVSPSMIPSGDAPING
jgi:hypothetical protein